MRSSSPPVIESVSNNYIEMVFWFKSLKIVYYPIRCGLSNLRGGVDDLFDTYVISRSVYAHLYETKIQAVHNIIDP
jgi:hypothetical protein